MSINELYNRLAMTGYNVIKRDMPASLSKDFKERYRDIPKAYLDFLNGFVLVTNQEDTAWFNTIEDFNGTSDSSFRWNEFEEMSLEVFVDDAEETARIRKFWDCHLPIALSVKDGYKYLCLGLSAEDFGRVYYGEEPEFEDSAELVCNSFDELIQRLCMDGSDNRLNAFR